MEAVIQEAASVNLDSGAGSVSVNFVTSVNQEEGQRLLQNNVTTDNVENSNTKELPNFSMVPSMEPIDMRFENIKFTATMGLFKKEKKEILHQVNGIFPKGKLIAIMGPSGAGKSTLLDVLSGYRITGIEGTVYINENPRDLNSFRKLSCYITQDDRLQDLLTVEENMYTAADLKLGTDVKKEQKDGIINEILKTLGLHKARHTRAGRISGGQKKRLSIALELVNNPLVMFLDEPTTGLDSSSCSQCVKLLKLLAMQGRTIVCTIHQPSASLFQHFDIVYVLAAGKCLYQGSTNQLVPFLDEAGFPCPMYHNPADYVIELACGEYGMNKVDKMVKATDNGKNPRWIDNYKELSMQSISIKDKDDTSPYKSTTRSLHATSSFTQLKILLNRGFLKSKRDSTLTYMRIIVNILVAIMLGSLYWQSGNDGSKVLDNYSLLFAILMHHMMSIMMLTILTFPSEMSVLIKEHFNRWYSLKMYYLTITSVDIPVSVISSTFFSIIVYYMTNQPLQMDRFIMFAVVCLLVVLIAQSFGLIIGALFGVINGTFLGPTLTVPIMMFAGFGVTLRDLPWYLHWGSYVSYLKYGLEGVVGAIYGMNRDQIYCPPDKIYCHYKYPQTFLDEVDMKGDQFWNDIISLVITLFFLRILAYVLIRYKLFAVR